MLPARFRVQRRRRETHDIFTMELAPTDGVGARRFAPGQFNMLYAFGVGEIPISISGDPAQPELLTHTTRVVGTVTKAMSRLTVGHMVGVRGPFGSRWPVEEAVGGDVVIVAGGIGLAPLRPVLLHVLAHRARYHHVTLLYGTRTPVDILYRCELEQWRARFDVDVHVTVDRAIGDPSTSCGGHPWRGNVGVVTTLIPRAKFDPAHATAMLCGPEVMMRFTLLELEQRGLGRERIYLSMERNMKCAIGFCGHCQYGADFICKDGPVFRYDHVAARFGKAEI